MKWLEYVSGRLSTREPQVPLRDLPYAEFQEWYGDFRAAYPDAEKEHRKTVGV